MATMGAKDDKTVSGLLFATVLIIVFAGMSSVALETIHCMPSAISMLMLFEPTIGYRVFVAGDTVHDVLSIPPNGKASVFEAELTKELFGKANLF